MLSELEIIELKEKMKNFCYYQRDWNNCPKSLCGNGCEMHGYFCDLLHKIIGE